MELCRSPQMGLEFTALRYFIPDCGDYRSDPPGSRDRRLCGLGRRGRHSEASLGRNSKIRKPDYLRDVA